MDAAALVLYLPRPTSPGAAMRRLALSLFALASLVAPLALAATPASSGKNELLSAE